MEKGLALKKIAVGRKDVFLVPPEYLEAEPGFNARLEYTGIDEIADFIRENGVLALPPLDVYRKGDHIYISDGHRRRRAIQKVIDGGIEVRGVPCMNDGGNEEARTFGLVTRNSGAPLTKLEQGIVFTRLINFGYTQAEIAKKVAKSPAYVSQCVSLAEVPKKVQDLMVTGMVNDSTVLTALGSVDSPEMVYDIIVQSMEDAKANAPENGASAVARNVSRAVRNRIGKETVSTRIKSFNEWIEENSLLLKGDKQYQLLCKMQSFLKGELPLDDLIPKK